MGRKSRHVRDESDLLLGYYSQTLAETSSVRNPSNALYSVTAGGGANDYDDTDDDANGNTGGLTSPLKRSLKLFRVNSPRKKLFHGNHVDEETPLKPKKKKNRYRVHRVSYTAQNHVQVLFRMYGSAFPQVLPFCIVNVIWMFVVVSLRDHGSIDLTFHSSVGHSFMGLLVSFLIVSRSKISYDRFMDFRRHLSVTYRTCREIAQFTTVYTFETQTPAARAWRQEVCYRTILLLRVTMDALLWSSTERDRWEEDYFTYKKDIDGDMPEEEVSEHFFRLQQLSHGRRSMIDENFRAPITFQHVLRRTIMEHPRYLGYKMAVNEYRDLLNFVTSFGEAFHRFRILVFTPYPFPLVQMTRAFLLFWVYTLPMVLLKDYRIWSSLLIVLLVTFGFVGIEYVSIALDDPLRDDTNDVDEHGMALLVYEDIYLALYRTDGPDSAFQLRERILQRYKKGRGLDCYRADLKGYDTWEATNYLVPNRDEESRVHDEEPRGVRFSA